MNDDNVTRAELERLQTEQSYQADTLQSLNEALSAQQMELMEMRQHLRLVDARLRELLAASADPEESGSRVEPPPPHY